MFSGENKENIISLLSAEFAQSGKGWIIPVDCAGIIFRIISQGPVVQSVVSLTSWLRVISLTVLADSVYNIIIFFAEKMWVAFAMQKLLTFFQQKISAYTRITWSKF